MAQRRLTRRKLLCGGAAAGAASLPALHPWDKALASSSGHHHGNGADPATHGSAHAGFRGEVAAGANPFDPHEIVRDFDWGRTSRAPGGGRLREWDLVAQDEQIEVAPGVKFAAWTYNKRVPGPTLRAREGDLMRVNFVNGSRHPHTIHFHGIHTARMDGVPGVGERQGAGEIEPGGRFTYEFRAEPFGLHLYHCHASPLPAHIAKGLYGAVLIDPRRGRPEADELVMVMNGFDTNFDQANEVYAVNTVGFAYLHRPIKVKRDRLVRIYLVNVLEFDPINSFHVHANFFHYYPTGTSLEPVEFTDTVVQGQGQRGILELRFPYPGRYMFHAHKTEFAELGWMGFFEVTD